MCRYELALELIFHGENKNIARFWYRDLFSRPIAMVAVYQGYLWLRQGSESDSELLRFELTFNRMAEALKGTP